MRLVAWNIRQGGGKRLSAIAEALALHDADIVVVSEYRAGDSAARLQAALAAIGYGHVTAALPAPGRNGVLIAARTPFDDGGPLSLALPEPCRIVRAYFGALCVYGVCMPNLLKKVPYWQALIAALAAESLGAHSIALGDFNTCRAYVDEPGAIDLCAHFLDDIEKIGFCDLWRRRNPDGREFSWYRAPAATAFASTTPSCRRRRSGVPGTYAIRMVSANAASPTIRCCCSISIADRVRRAGQDLRGGPARATSCISPSLAAIAML